MHSSDGQEYLDTFANYEARLHKLHSQSFDLDRVRRLLAALGNPQNRLNFIHVAGTKGKGSVAAFCAYILRASGYRVGLYTSPHLYRLHERIRVLSPEAAAEDLKNDFYGAISDDELDVLVRTFRRSIDKVRKHPQTGSPTYFEVLTGLALCYFVRRKTDIVVLETGLGGRLDATNAVDAVVNGITPISFDHTNLLGRSLSKIAAEKAAIIKNPKSGVVIGTQPAEAMKVIRARCAQLGIKPLVVGKDIRVRSVAQGFSVTTPSAQYKQLNTILAGEHQLQNAAMAVGMVGLCGLKIAPKAVAEGIGQTRWPGRFEIFRKNPAVVVDCAHNTASAEVLMRSVRQNFPGKTVILVLGLSNDKDIKGICAILEKKARLILTTQSRHPRAYRFLDIEMKSLFKNKPALNVENIEDALKIAHREATPKDIILVAGSIFIAAEARSLLKR
jgi:dihydrofolate synthase/folylpolyglutamate synthase